MLYEREYLAIITKKKEFFQFLPFFRLLENLSYSKFKTYPYINSFYPFLFKKNWIENVKVPNPITLL